MSADGTMTLVALAVGVVIGALAWQAWDRASRAGAEALRQADLDAHRVVFGPELPEPDFNDDTPPWFGQPWSLDEDRRFAAESVERGDDDLWRAE